jgi:large subunit ribosomal protein L17
MRKMVFGKQLSRGRKAREALFTSLVKALVTYGKIKTTKAKAKAVQRDVDKLVTLAKEGSLTATRRISRYFGNDRRLSAIFSGKIAQTFKDRKGGYTRIILLPHRRGDFAELARLEWTEPIQEEQPKLESKFRSKSKTEKTKEVKTKTKKQI